MKLARLTEDHSRAPVPDSDRIDGMRMTLLITNTVVCVPNFLIGTQIVAGAGMSRALVAFFVGGIILAAMAAVTAFVGARANLSTSMIIQFSFGQRGGQLVNTVLLAAILGGYAVIAAVFGKALRGTIESVTGLAPNMGICTAIGSAAMVLVIIFGFRSLKMLAAIAVPLLSTLIGIMLFYARTVPGRAFFGGASHDIKLPAAISAVIGSYVIGVVVLPDMMRFIKTTTQGIVASSFSLGVALPSFLWVAALIAATTGPMDPARIVVTLGLGVPALLVLTFVSWSNNANNLYSSSLVFAAIIPSVPKWQLVIVAGAIGTALALLPVIDTYLEFLQVLSVLLPPLAGIYVSDFFLVRRQRYRLDDLGPTNRINYGALGIWVVSAACGGLASRGSIHSSTVPGIDSMLIAFSLHALLTQATARRRARPETATSSETLP